MDLRGKWVLVTGASAGLGREMARQLALEHGANLLITARRLERLNELKAELEGKAKVEVVPLTGDMGSPEDVDKLLAAATTGRTISCAILNAGITHLGPHHELAWADFQSMLQINVSSTVRMTNELVRHMEAHGHGGAVMLVSSMAGINPVPFQAAYTGTKAFLVGFGGALAYELAPKKISVTVFAPGGVQTEMTSTDRFAPLSGWLAPAPEVAREGIAAMRAREVLHVPGFLNRLGLFVFRFMPRNFVTGQLGRTYRKALAVQQPKPS